MYDILVRYDEALSILSKIKKIKEPTYESKVSSQKPFGLRTYVTPTEKDDIQLRYSGGIGPFERDKVTTKVEWIDKFKVIMSYLTYDHAGRPDKDGKRRIFSTMDLLPPGVICTETYIVIDVFNTKKEAENLIKYLKTNFVRFLVGLISTTQHISKNSFSFVPVQDFSKSWTDEKLYEKYGITESEQKFIESLIKPME
jgi:site-specific DNA-methyltransferase (adenine-specific)